MSNRTRISFDTAEKFDKELIAAVSYHEHDFDFEDDDNHNQSCLKHERLLKAVRKIIRNELTPHQKKIFTLYYASKKSVYDIAEELGVSASAVSKSLRLIKKKIAMYIKYVE